MIILGIETSFDETAAAIVEDGRMVLADVMATSQKLHVKTGGAIPEVAARQQLKYIIPVLDEALKTAKLERRNIDAIAVTYGPGLIGSLLVGVETAKTLAQLWGKPIIPVNHLVAHIYANWITTDKSPEFPAVALVVSGGHTDFVLMKSHDDIKWTGGTRDDAAGEAFDKTARLIRLPYPGGPSIAAEADNFLVSNPDFNLNLFPRPMINSGDLDMSFSGLKTSVLTFTNSNPHLKVQHIAAEIQEAIVDTLVDKVCTAVELYKPKSFLLAGGVSANTRLRGKVRQKFHEKNYSIDIYLPEPKYSTDNAAMIAACAYFKNSPVPVSKVTANPSLSIEQ